MGVLICLLNNSDSGSTSSSSKLQVDPPERQESPAKPKRQKITEIQLVQIHLSCLTTDVLIFKRKET